MAIGNQRKQEEDSSIDMTPMLDIVFIMLIFFIVTTVFVREAGIEVTKPTVTNLTPKPKAYIFVGVSENGDIYIDKNSTEPNRVKTEIERLMSENAEGAVVIQADVNSPAGAVLQIIDAAKSAGVKDISVAGAAEG